jgi:hypothetical protein
MTWRVLSDQIHGRLCLLRQIVGLSVTMHVHIENAGIFKEKMIMDRGYFETVVEQG